jgi:hypothetical protein
MSDQISKDLEDPDDARAADGQRRDGRPSTGSIDDRPATDAERAPTEAPEETGGSPTTEHAPGGDL